MNPDRPANSGKVAYTLFRTMPKAKTDGETDYSQDDGLALGLRPESTPLKRKHAQKVEKKFHGLSLYPTP